MWFPSPQYFQLQAFSEKEAVLPIELLCESRDLSMISDCPAAHRSRLLIRPDLDLDLGSSAASLLPSTVIELTMRSLERSYVH